MLLLKQTQNLNYMAEKKQFVATDEAKGKAKQLRLIAFILWILALGAQVWAITELFKDPITMWIIITLIVVDLALVIVGSLLWKKSNKLDPPSEKRAFLFFMKSQLGLITAVVAFLPLVIFILTNKNIDKKQKAILGGIAGAALVIAGISGADFNPPSVEKYTEQINQQTDLITDLTNGVDHVYWTPSGNKLHVFDDCQHIRNSDVSDGTVKDAWEARGIDDNEVCKTCINRAEKLKSQDNANVIDAVGDVLEDATEE